MGRQGSFEDKITSKFTGQAAKAPKNVWGNIEGRLNYELVIGYESTRMRYKWVAVAAMVIAICSLTIQYFPISSESGASSFSGKTYNALLSDNVTYRKIFSNSNTRLFGNNILVVPVTVTQQQEDRSMRESSDNIFLADVATMDQMESKKHEVATANVDGEIYPYLQVFYPSRYSIKKDNTDNKLWAGIEAGAGNFNSINQSEIANGGINTLNLASVLGSNGFINPSTVVSPNMDDGIATTLGVDFGMKLGKKWTLESGLAYTSVDTRGNASISILDSYTISNGDLGESGIDASDINPGSREAPRLVENNYDYEVDLRNNIRFTSIPVKAGYFIVDRKLSLRLNAGLSANYFVSSNLKDSNFDIINSSQSSLYNDWSFDGIGGLEFGYSIFNNFDFTVEPNYRHAITPLSNSISSPSRFSVQTGLRYTLR